MEGLKKSVFESHIRNLLKEIYCIDTPHVDAETVVVDYHEDCIVFK